MGRKLPTDQCQLYRPLAAAELRYRWLGLAQPAGQFDSDGWRDRLGQKNAGFFSVTEDIFGAKG